MEAAHNPTGDDVSLNPNYDRVTTDPDISPQGLAALRYAKHGWHVFPCWWPQLGQCACGDTGCGSPAKHPIAAAAPRGFHDATTDLDQVAEWWVTWPQANVAIALGASGLLVLDVDGPDGANTLNRLTDQNEPLPDTFTADTGRAEGHGVHHYFLQPDSPIGNRKLVSADSKLEIKGDGGYVIAAPSIHASGRHYSWRNTTTPQPADTPSWLLELADKPAPTPTPTITGPTGSDHVAEKRLRGLAGNLALMQPDTGRNDTLNHAAYTAGRLIIAGRLDRDHAEQVLTTAALRSGLTPSETAKTIASGIDSAAGNPDYDHMPGAAQAIPAVSTITGQTDTPDSGPDDPDDPLAGLETLVAQEVARILARDRARELVTARQLEQEPPPPLVRLDQFLAQPDPDITYRIDGLWPSDGRCLLSAQYKAGKTTTVGNILRCLVDGEPLFSTYPVSVPDGRIVLFDDELHENTLRRWLRDQGIVNTERIHVVPLRGKLSTFNLLDDATRARWAEQIRAVDGAIVILDCLRPIIDALGLSEDKDTGKVLTAFDELLEQAGVTEGLIVHHMGHAGERSRGDSRLRDWPDAEWKLVREVAEDGVDDPLAARYFSAVGRDVEVTEQRLALTDGRRLEIVGGSRKAMKEWELVAKVIQAVLDEPGIAKRSVPSVVGGSRNKALDAVDIAVRDGYLEAARGGGLTACVPAVPDYPRNGGTPPVTTVENPDRSARSDPPEHPRSAAPKGERRNGQGTGTPGTPHGAQEVPLQ